MKKNGLISLLLATIMVLTSFPIVVPVFAEETKGMYVSKKAKALGNDKYEITLEAYATGSTVISEINKDMPTDIILVLDQSGSMAESMTVSGFKQYINKTNSDLYYYRNNGGNQNLYYELSDGSYSKVDITYDDSDDSYQAVSFSNNADYYNSNETLYACINGTYYEVTIEEDTYLPYYRYYANDTIIAEGWYNKKPNFENIDGNSLYKNIDTTNRKYIYTYTDTDGSIKTLYSTGSNTIPYFALYYSFSDTSNTRLDSLVDAATLFVDEVAKKAGGDDQDISTPDDNINHRIAIVGFSSEDYGNTELLTGNTITTGDHNYGTKPSTGNTHRYYPTGYEKNGPNYYDGINDTQYKNALQDMDSQSGLANVRQGIEAITAYGGTQTADGIKMANNIFEQNPIDTSKRNRVVIIFTDGAPGNQGDWASASRDVANAAINETYKSKHTYSSSVYTIGIFDGADASTPTPLPTYTTNNLNETKRTANSNRFMHLMSSNYLDSTSMKNTGDVNPELDGNSFYLSASDADTLKDIFKKISEQIESGGTSVKLNEEAIVKDIISPQFELPKGTTAKDITVETYQCTGKDSNVYTWKKNDGAMGATASINDDQVSVTGFDFAKNYVGTITEGDSKPKYIGNKLVIKFTVKPKAGFLGGNNVFTNVTADIYENSSAKDPVVTFNRPQVNVPIKDISITPSDKNVYLLGSLTGKQLKEGSTVKCGDVILDLTKDNYGLDSWQTDYVNITTTVKDLNGTSVTDKISDLKGDSTYSIEVTISPKDIGLGASGDPAKPQSNSGKGKINVYKPFVTVSDSIAYYGDTAPTDFSSNRTIDWKHGDNVADTKNMGNAPDLSLKYDHVGTDVISNGKINTKNDIPVSITAKINTTDITSNTSFMHECTCGYTDCDKPENGEFWIHVKTCNLTISKKGGSDDETYVFKIKKDGSDYTEVSITGNGNVTIYELPVGEYTVEEDTAWSWRYSKPTINYSGTSQSATLSSTKPTDTAVVTNNRKSQNWLNGFSTVVQNIFGKANN